MLTIPSAVDLVTRDTGGNHGRSFLFFLVTTLIVLAISLIVRASRTRALRDGIAPFGPGAPIGYRGYPGTVPTSSQAWVSQPKTPEQVLAERLVKGEIDEADYISRLAALRDGATP